MYVIKQKFKNERKKIMNLIIIFVLLNIANVIIQTVKSIATIKCGKTMAAIVNAVAYGLYTVVVVYTVCDLPLWFKVVVVAVANLIGVFVVKLFEEKSRKDKLWKVEATIRFKDFDDFKTAVDSLRIPYNYFCIKKYYLFNFYAETQEQSRMIKKVLDNFDAKYFVSETKELY